MKAPLVVSSPLNENKILVDCASVRSIVATKDGSIVFRFNDGSSETLQVKPGAGALVNAEDLMRTVVNTAQAFRINEHRSQFRIELWNMAYKSRLDSFPVDTSAEDHILARRDADLAVRSFDRSHPIAELQTSTIKPHDSQ